MDNKNKKTADDNLQQPRFLKGPIIIPQELSENGRLIALAEEGLTETDEFKKLWAKYKEYYE